MGNLGKLGELADGSVFFTAIIQRAILYATVKSLYFKSPITHTKTDIASSINKGSIQNTLGAVHKLRHAKGGGGGLNNCDGL